MKKEKPDDIVPGIDATPEEIARAALNVSPDELDDEAEHNGSD